MPAVSEPALPRTWRPFGVRVAGAVLGLLLLGVCAMAWFSFDPEIRARFTPFQRGTIVVLGLMFYLAGYGLGRSRVVAHPDRLVVVNGYRRHDYDYSQVIAVHLPPGAPWATLDLADGTNRPAMGIQGSDGERARRAVAELRRVLDRPVG